MQKNVLLMILAGMVAVLAYLQWRPAPAGDRAVTDEVRALRDEVGALRRQVNQPARGAWDRNVEDPAGSVADVVPPDPSQPDDAVSDPEVLRDEDEAVARAARQLGFLENIMAGEGRDAQWSVWAEGALGEAINVQTVAGATDVVIRCGRSMCRLELRFTDLSAMDRAMGTIPHLSPWQGQGFFQLDKQDNVAHLIIAREGMDLPVSS